MGKHRNVIYGFLSTLVVFATFPLSAQTFQNLPQKTGEVLVVDDWDYEITRNDLGFNYFSGNTGAIESQPGIATQSASSESSTGTGGSLALTVDFQGAANEAFAGYFASLFGLTDTLISLDGSGLEPNGTTALPGYFLDFADLYRGFAPLAGRSAELLELDVRLLSDDATTLRIELTDEAGSKVFTRRPLLPGGWQTLSLALPGDFEGFLPGGLGVTTFDWGRVSVFSLIVERRNVGDGIQNPDRVELLLDNLQLVDTDGQYPDLAAARDGAGNLLPDYETAFLDWVRATSSLYFLDFASTDPRTGGIIQDRGNFADLMTVGGVGFQLSAYVIAAERGYLDRADTAGRTLAILRALHDAPQGPQRVGTAGHRGFFYHFLGIDGLRKQNFDFQATPDVDEALNTVELSTIDTALALAGVVTAGQYFQGSDATETEIRTLADALYARVDWPFMLEPGSCQFYLGWKPNELNEGPPFDLPDGAGEGHYSGRPGEPQTVDYYTDEGLLIALLAMASPEPAHRVDRCVWNNMVRDRNGADFVKTYPGTLFTYQFAPLWLNTALLGTDNHPSEPVNFHQNTRAAILATIDYATRNPEGRATLNALRWGLSAVEGPFDGYFAEAAPDAAIAPPHPIEGSEQFIEREAENGTEGALRFRSNASEGQTRWLTGQTLNLLFSTAGGSHEVRVRYSNDNFGPSEQVRVRIDGQLVGSFLAEDTGDFGDGWNSFRTSPPLGPITLAAGQYTLTIDYTGGDDNGIEIDRVDLETGPVSRLLEVGTVSHYAVGSSMVHVPRQALASLWNSAVHEDLNQDGIPELLHPRFGLADGFNLDIRDAAIPGAIDCESGAIFRCDGPWASFPGFAINHGPMLIMIDNYLSGGLIPELFMSHPGIDGVLRGLSDGYYSTVWWDPARSGQGIQVWREGEIVSGAWYLYDAMGEGQWVTFVGELNGNQVDTSLLRFTGPALGDPWDVDLVQGVPVGNVQLRFDSGYRLQFSYLLDGVQETLSLRPFEAYAGGPQTGVWYEPARSGQGVQLLQRDDALSGAWYLYDGVGQGQWVTFVGELSGDLLDTPLLGFQGPPLGSPWDPTLVQASPVGQLQLRVISPTEMVFDYRVDGVEGQLRLLPFSLAR